jgi:hypothetical protein
MTKQEKEQLAQTLRKARAAKKIVRDDEAANNDD